MIKTLGLILKKQNIGETDRIITIFSPQLGKKRIIARAVRRPLSKLAGHLDTLMVSQLILTDEPDLPKVTSAVLVESFRTIRGSLELTNRAFSLCRIVERVILEDVSQRPIFQLTVDAFDRLNTSQKWLPTWLFFLSGLADRLGLGVSHFTCRNCHQQLTTAAWWSLIDRRFTCSNCRTCTESGMKLNANSIKLLQVLRRKPFSFLAAIQIPQANAQEVEELLLREITEWFNRPWQSYSGLAFE